MKSFPNVKGAAMIAGMVVSWSVFYAVSKIVVSVSGSAFTAGLLLRSAAFVFLSVQLLADGSYKQLFHPGRAVWLLLCIGLFGFLLDLFANLGYARGSLSTGTALLKTDVLMVNAATVLIYRKRLLASDWIGTVIMLLGVLLVLGIDPKEISFNSGDMFFILSALCVTVNAFLIKSAQEKYGQSANMISYYNNTVVLLLFLAGAAGTGGLRFERLGSEPGFWWLVALGGLAQTSIYYFYYRNLRCREVWTVKLYLLLMPVLSCFIGWAFLDETLTASKLLGIAVVLAGAAVILLRGRHIGKSEAKT